MRTRGKTALAFSLIVPSSSAIRMKVAVLLQEQWRKAGANVRIEPLEVNTFGSLPCGSMSCATCREPLGGSIRRASGPTRGGHTWRTGPSTQSPRQVVLSKKKGPD